MKLNLLFISIGLVYCSAQSQTVSNHPCATDPHYRQFDFWIGEWEAFTPAGKKAGDSRISRILDSCIILEEWTGTNGYSGKSFNTYNAGTEQWQQTWVDNIGGTTEFLRGEYEEGKMIFYADHVKDIKSGREFLRKLTFIRVNENKVRQVGERSQDGAVTWQPEYDLEYRRKK